MFRSARTVSLCVIAALVAGCPEPPPPHPDLVVTVDWDGASAEDVESQLLTPLEQRVGSVKWLTSVKGAAWDGRAEVRLGFDSRALPEEPMQGLTAALDGFAAPPGADAPEVSSIANRGEVVEAVLGSDATAAEVATWVDGVKASLLATKGVHDVEVVGLGEPRVRVALDARLLDKQKLDAAAVSEVVKTCLGPQASVDSLETCTVGTDPEKPVTLGEVAAIEQVTTWERRVWFDGKSAVRLVAHVDKTVVEATRGALTSTRGPGQAWLVLLPPSSVTIEMEGAPSVVDQGRKRIDEAVVGDAWMVADVFADGNRATLRVGLPPETALDEAVVGLRKSAEVPELDAMVRTPTTRCLPITISGPSWSAIAPAVPVVVDAIRGVDGFVGALADADAGHGGFAVTAEAEKLERKAVTGEALGKTVDLATDGVWTGTLGSEGVNVYVTLGRGGATLKDLPRVAIAGRTTIGDVATVEPAGGRVLPVRHDAGLPKSTVQACMAPRDLPSVLQARAKTAVGKLELPEGVTAEVGSL
jgi:multidrug efflux pump subunit AcrB